ncbi:MAG: hypothetical protein JWP65_2848 [Ramlibacter sp.]|jgi:hypothetical protein|uniref:hypothetical protein n=1 Tax=Ramlibacter sp. TaxID=1917967 RepID=UPI0026067BC4|nr:hypothetical protein [Ramlibacter sp.]MDB5752427.1 hypothetical protein [Ramlibacter sp.]
MRETSRARAAAAGVGCALLSIALGTSGMLLVMAMYWMLGSTAVAFGFGAAVRALLDSPELESRSMKAIARAAQDMSRTRVYRRTAVAVYLYMAGMLFSVGAVGTILVVNLVFLRE